MSTTLQIETEFTVRFNEVDSLGIVWHGNYAQYFEDGREAFGKAHGISYLDILDWGYYAPLVSLNFDFKKPLVYGDRAKVLVRYRPMPAAKIIFDYEIRELLRGELIATGTSIQVFLDKAYCLALYNPPFYEAWKRKNKLS